MKSLMQNQIIRILLLFEYNLFLNRIICYLYLRSYIKSFSNTNKKPTFCNNSKSNTPTKKQSPYRNDSSDTCKFILSCFQIKKSEK